MYDEYIKDINKNFHNNYGKVYISEYQLEVLKKYNIDVYNFSNNKELILYLENILNDNYYEDLEEVSRQISEDFYYNNINK